MYFANYSEIINLHVMMNGDCCEVRSSNRVVARVSLGPGTLVLGFWRETSSVTLVRVKSVRRDYRSERDSDISFLSCGLNHIPLFF